MINPFIQMTMEDSKELIRLGIIRKLLRKRAAVMEAITILNSDHSKGIVSDHYVRLKLEIYTLEYKVIKDSITQFQQLDPKFIDK